MIGNPSASADTTLYVLPAVNSTSTTHPLQIDAMRARGVRVLSERGDFEAHPEATVIYAHNDEMAMGAISALEAAGKVPGKDVLEKIEASYHGPHGAVFSSTTPGFDDRGPAGRPSRGSRTPSARTAWTVRSVCW